MTSVGYARIGALPQNFNSGAPSFANVTADANNDGCAWAWSTRDANAITHFGFRYGARTGTPPTYVLTLEGLSTSTGFPDATDVGGGSPTATTFTPPADTTWNGTWRWIALTNAYTPTKGQYLCATIRYSSGTVDGSNNSSFTVSLSSVGPAAFQVWPHRFTLAAGTWTANADFPVFCVRSASTRYGYPVESIYSTETASTVGHRKAMKFNLPSGMGDTFKVAGVRFAGRLGSGAGKNPILGLWSASSVIQNVTLDGDIPPSVLGGNRVQEYYFDESSLTALSFGTDYYIGLEVADAASAMVRLDGIEMDSSDDGAAYPFGASNFIISDYNGSSWTDNAVAKPQLELILEDITEPAGGSGPIPRFGQHSDGPTFRGAY